ncbi:MAG: type I restriction enzyme HsdR N-terminal domain-containing protein [Desulfatiglans sp.]|nr:type I restriction enzyme HsdR N-terminal domain-containing protein [Desulfatiglans sp.]
MTSNEKWNLLCDYYVKNYNSPEQKIQSIWESIFSELFGYSRLENEIDRQRNIQIGSTERVITDIIIRNHETDLFIIELKQGCMFINNSMIKQLFSYLKQLNNDLGILICNKIHIFDYNYHKNDEEQNKIEIEFLPDNPDGIKFVELFSKHNFNKESIKKFIQQKKEKFENIQVIKKELLKDLIWDLLAKHFLSRYTKEEFDEATKSFNINISQVNSAIQESISKQPITNNDITGTHAQSLSKSDAINLCKQNGINVNGFITFSSENASNLKFWANPSKKCLTQNWWLLLNDVSRRQLHVFYIPGNSIQENQIKTRGDLPDKIDLQIINKNSIFEDSRSKLNFNKWYFKNISVAY